MEIVADTSALLAVILAEPERERIVEATSGHTLIGPGSIPWEIGNAFSAMLRQRRLEVADAQEALRIYSAIPIRLVAVDLHNAISIANETNTYAYDAYFLDCAGRYAAPLLTLDHSLQRAAAKVGVELMKV